MNSNKSIPKSLLLKLEKSCGKDDDQDSSLKVVGPFPAKSYHLCKQCFRLGLFISSFVICNVVGYVLINHKDGFAPEFLTTNFFMYHGPTVIGVLLLYGLYYGLASSGIPNNLKRGLTILSNPVALKQILDFSGKD